jgi:hypothetical protein
MCLGFGTKMIRLCVWNGFPLVDRLRHEKKLEDYYRIYIII